jgi:hypothetical protein
MDNKKLKDFLIKPLFIGRRNSPNYNNADMANNGSREDKKRIHAFDGT